jgi:hypothetical protein
LNSPETAQVIVKKYKPETKPEKTKTGESRVVEKAGD